MKYTSNGILVDGKEYTLNELSWGVLTEKVKENDSVIFEIIWEETRNCPEIYEKIVLNKNDANRLMGLMIGTEIIFGEIHGKHSYISGIIEECDVSIEEKQTTVVDFLRRNPSGYDSNHSFTEIFFDMADSGGNDLNLSDEDLEFVLNV